MPNTRKTIKIEQSQKEVDFIDTIKYLIRLNLSDNILCDRVYCTLQKHLESSVKTYAVHQNIYAIYFVDLMKFFSGIVLRKSELDRSKDWPLSGEYLSTKRFDWPYILHKELRDGFELNQFNWGRQYGSDWKLRFKQFLTNFNFFKEQQVKVSFSRRFASKAMIQHAIKRGIAFNVVGLHNNTKLAIPDLELQLNQLPMLFREVCEIISMPDLCEQLLMVFNNHIRANCFDGFPARNGIGDILVAGCGAEMENRMLASIATSYGAEVLNSIHGGSYWVQDKPNFKEGEKLLCTDYFAYGSSKEQDPGIERRLFNGSYAKVSSYKQSVVSSPKSWTKVMYVPTSFSWGSRRHGPFESLPDNFYEYIWYYTNQLFGNSLTIKVHPKCDLSRNFCGNIVFGPLENHLDKADVFLFDYNSTAFTEVAATSKPIIFFDYKIQKFKPTALRALKSRTIYFDMVSRPPRSLEEIKIEADNGKFDNVYTSKFVAQNGQRPLEDVLFDEIKTRIER